MKSLDEIKTNLSFLKDYEVVFGNRHDISEYFYGFRKVWNDMKHRIEVNRFRSMEEKVAALKRGMGSRARIQK